MALPDLTHLQAAVIFHLAGKPPVPGPELERHLIEEYWFSGGAAFCQLTGRMERAGLLVGSARSSRYGVRSWQITRLAAEEIEKTRRFYAR